ncbi:MAG: AlpA family phage regulatory protein [Rhodoferax sp.]|jgi:hypothetical protein|nr:AlpA family phage regulatory protein [Rhodoferax sp.]
MTRGFNSKEKKPATTAGTTKPTATAPAATSGPAQAVFDRLPGSAYVRESQLVRSTKRTDSETAPLPYSAPTLRRNVQKGTFPKPVKLSQRVSAWIVREVRAMNQAYSAGLSEAEIKALVRQIHEQRTLMVTT